MPIELQITQTLEKIDPKNWNRLCPNQYPFTRHEFLYALETSGAVGKTFGWYPHYFLAYDQDQQDKLVAACTLYLKTNSYGELVFDWAWADAYQRSGLAYYPKAVVAIPYTPAPGHRILIATDADQEALTTLLINATLAFARDQQLSSLHWLFTDDALTERLEKSGFLRRTGVQYHWFNQSYVSFDAFLQTFSAKKRKNVRQERRKIQEQGISFGTFLGHELDEAQLQEVAMYYRITFDRKSGYATFNLDFFRQIARTMGHQLVVFFAYRNEESVACSICYRDDQALYGRHWGCRVDLDMLHFELCYYQGIEYCIAQGLARFEPGAQGEYKISRGFVPTRTWSAHWLSHPEFYRIIDRYLEQETEGMEALIEELQERTPFKKP